MANRLPKGIAHRNTSQFPRDAALPTRTVLTLRVNEAEDTNWRKFSKPLRPAREERDLAHRHASVRRLAVRAIFGPGSKTARKLRDGIAREVGQDTWSGVCGTDSD